MKGRSLDSGFENYRRERTRRRLTAGQPLRHLGEQAELRAELEKAEAAELQDERLTREVKEFFADAKRTAASIVKKVAEMQEAAATERISEEMQEFLVDAIQRMGDFVDLLKEGELGNASENIEPHMHNLVGPMLDSFRLEGTAQLENQHLGEDPFDTEVDNKRASRQGEDRDDSPPDASSTEPEAEPEIEKIASVAHPEASERLHEHELSPEVVMETDTDPETSEVDLPEEQELHTERGLPGERELSGDDDLSGEDQPGKAEVTAQTATVAHPLLEGIMGDETKLKGALRLLVSGGLMSKEQARSIYRTRSTS